MKLYEYEAVAQGESSDEPDDALFSQWPEGTPSSFPAAPSSSQPLDVIGDPIADTWFK